MLFYSESCASHPVDYFLVCTYHLLLRAIAHWFDEYVVCVEVNGHHYIPVAPLRCEGECSSLIGVDGMSDVIDAEESLVCFGDGDLVERLALAFNLYPHFFVFDDFFLMLPVLSNKSLGVALSNAP